MQLKWNKTLSNIFAFDTDGTKGGWLEAILYNHIRKAYNIEIFYKNQPIALDKPDFILYPDNKQFGVSGPLILECKFKEKIDDDARQQLKTYLKSAPLNSNLNLKNIKLGIIIN